MSYEEFADEPDHAQPIPNTVLVPAISLLLAAAVTGCAALLGVVQADGPARPVMMGILAVALVATGVGLWRRSRIAHTVAYVIGGLVALTIVGLIPGVALVASLSTRSAKDWFNIR